MPASYSIHPDRNLVHITFKGCLTKPEVLRMREDLVTDPAYRAGFVEFIDMSETQDFSIDHNGMMGIIRQYQNLFATHGFPRCMIIFAPGDLGFGMARMFENMTSEDIRFAPILTQTRPEALAQLQVFGIARPEARELLEGL